MAAVGSMNCGNSAAKNITAKGLALEVMNPCRNKRIGEPAPSASASSPCDVRDDQPQADPGKIGNTEPFDDLKCLGRRGDHGGDTERRGGHLQGCSPSRSPAIVHAALFQPVACTVGDDEKLAGVGWGRKEDAKSPPDRAGRFSMVIGDIQCGLVSKRNSTNTLASV